MSENMYETERALSEYLLFHYGKDQDQMPWSIGPSDAVHYPLRCALMTAAFSGPCKSVLDLGCAVGRSSFELARTFGSVLGIDFSQSFVDAASKLQESGSLDFSIINEGNRSEQRTAQIDREIPRERVSFEQGDACKLREDIGSFDAVLMANLIDRLAAPGRLIDRLPDLVAPSGIAVITSPYTWLEEFTPPDQWLCGEGGCTFDALHERMTPAFALLDRRDIPFLIREHRRKFQWSVAEATVWKRQ